MSMLSFCVSTAIVSILFSIAYANLSHINCASIKPLDWRGGLYVISFVYYWSIGIISARVDSECITGKKVSGIFLMLIAGATLGLPFTWIVGTLSYGFGGTVAVTVYMGMGIGSFDLSWAFGLDIGIDVMGGISHPIYIYKKDNC